MLAKVEDGSSRWMGIRNDQPLPKPPVDEAWIAPTLEAVEAGRPYVIDSSIANCDRAVGIAACR